MTQVIMCSMHNYMTPTHTELNLISQEGKKQGNKVGVIPKKKKKKGYNPTVHIKR